MIFLCGFCGFMNKSDLVQNDKIICSMVNRIKKRGPNAQNVYIDGNVAFGHARLSIIDVKNGNQPMIKDFNNNKYVIIYNGELYNTEDLRKANILLYRISGILILNLMGIKDWKLNTEII